MSTWLQHPCNIIIVNFLSWKMNFDCKFLRSSKYNSGTSGVLKILKGVGGKYVVMWWAWSVPLCLPKILGAPLPFFSYSPVIYKWYIRQQIWVVCCQVQLIACKSDTAGLLKTWFSVKKFTEKLRSCQLDLGRLLFSMVWHPRWPSWIFSRPWWPSRPFSHTRPSSIDNYEYK